MAGWVGKGGALSLGLATVLAACAVDRAPDGARRTPAGDGPHVVFDLVRRPLPEIPLPNDVATFADPTSRTGRRPNVSLVGSSQFDSAARAALDALEGWGTFAPITVAFAKSAATGELEPAIDLESVNARTRDYDPSDDPFYVIDLATGLPAPLDVGKGNFPLALVDRTQYWPNDPHGNEDPLVFESLEEAAGIPQSAYRPQIDLDFDGVVDHPNSLSTNASGRIDSIIDWYERETDTLRLRPAVPLAESREYAVVLTDRLRAPNGAPIRSPFEFVHHADQQHGAERIRQILGDPNQRAWFGDIAGTGLDHVAFVWTFTTQPVYDDMRALRDGLQGRGAFAHLATDFPADSRAFRAVGTTADEAGAIDSTPACAPRRGTPYVVKAADSKDVLARAFPGLSAEERSRFESSLDNVDHFVIGSFESPFFVGDPKKEDPGAKFDLDFRRGAGTIHRDTVQFWVSVPKAKGAAKQPFPVTVWAHEERLEGEQVVLRAGYFARQGLAMMAIHLPWHGFAMTSLPDASNVFRDACLAPWVEAIGSGRSSDVDGDGIPDSGGLLGLAQVSHVRDILRQAVVDEMQATRVLRSYDGVRRSSQDYNLDGTPDLAGDFDADGVPDLGGPSVPITTAGSSLGGMVAMIHGALDPNVVAAAPISGGAGLVDVGTRGDIRPNTFLGPLLTPLVVAVPANTLASGGPTAQTRCSGADRSLRFVTSATSSPEIEIACLPSADLDVGKTVVVENVRTHERRCARTGPDGRFAVPVPATAGDHLDVQIYNAPDIVASYKGCEIGANAPVGRRIRTFEQAAPIASPADPDGSKCAAAVAAADVGSPGGCQVYRGHFFPVGSSLVAPEDGLGLNRQSPELRRMLDLAQAVMDPGDPINFAPYYGLRPAPSAEGGALPPRAILETSTAGDPVVPSATGYAFARAAGAVPFLPPAFAETHADWAGYATPPALWEQLGGRTPNQVLVDTHVIEGASRLERTRGGPNCAPNYVASAACTSPPPAAQCDNELFDADWLSEGRNRWDAPHPALPPRLARFADAPISDAASVVGAWGPRLVGVPFAPDSAAPATRPILGALNAWIAPSGQHGFVAGNACKAFDDVVYSTHLLVRFLATQGTDLYVTSHPSSHACLERETCPFFP